MTGSVCPCGFGEGLVVWAGWWVLGVKMLSVMGVVVLGRCDGPVVSCWVGSMLWGGRGEGVRCGRWGVKEGFAGDE